VGLLSVDNILEFVLGYIVVVVVGIGLYVSFVGRLQNYILL